MAWNDQNIFNKNAKIFQIHLDMNYILDDNYLEIDLLVNEIEIIFRYTNSNRWIVFVEWITS